MSCETCNKLKIQLAETNKKLDDARSNLYTEIRYHKESKETQLTIIERVSADNRLLSEHRDMLVKMMNTYINNEESFAENLKNMPIEKLQTILEIQKQARLNAEQG